MNTKQTIENIICIYTDMNEQAPDMGHMTDDQIASEWFKAVRLYNEYIESI